MNTHVKRATLIELIELYDNFLNDLFESEEYDGDRFHYTWRNVFRIRPSELEQQPLQKIIEEIKDGYRSRTRLRELSRRFYEDE
jgi:hypothetical protein